MELGSYPGGTPASLWEAMLPADRGLTFFIFEEEKAISYLIRTMFLQENVYIAHGPSTFVISLVFCFCLLSSVFD